MSPDHTNIKLSNIFCRSLVNVKICFTLLNLNPKIRPVAGQIFLNSKLEYLPID